MQRFLRRIQYWFRARRLEADLAEEIEVHRAMTEERLRRGGLPLKEAADASRRALGRGSARALSA